MEIDVNDYIAALELQRNAALKDAAMQSALCQKLGRENAELKEKLPKPE